MSQRTAWKFRYTAASLIEPTQKKIDYHNDRFVFWMKEEEQANKALKEQGVEVRDVPVTGGYRATLVLDPQRQQRVEECRSKLNEHKAQVEEYHRWHRALMANPDAVLDLDIGDMEFFGL